MTQILAFLLLLASLGHAEMYNRGLSYTASTGGWVGEAAALNMGYDYTLNRWSPFSVDPSGFLRTVIADNGNLDPFGRLRISESTTLWDGKFTEKQINPLMWTTSTVGAGSAVALDTAHSAVTVTAAAVAGSWSILQTRQYIPYQPGKGQQILITGNWWTGVLGATKRIGSFDENDGTFFQLSGTTMSVCIRKNGVDTCVAQSAWNIDKMNGSGPTGLTLDISKGQIHVIDYEWLGLGRVRFGFNIDGVTHYVHQVLHANRSVTTTYMTDPDLPVRYEARGVSYAASVLTAICSSVISEGGSNSVGVQSSASTPLAGYVIGASDSAPKAVVSLRAVSWHAQALIKPLALSIASTSAADLRWSIVMNPTFAPPLGTWNRVTNTAVDYNVGVTNTVTLENATVLDSGFITQASGDVTLNLLPSVGTGLTVAGVSDVLSVVLEKIDNQAETVYVSVKFKQE